MSETTETGDISIKQLGQITWLSDYSAYDTYFLASIAQGDSWSTKNVSYVNLSNDLYAVISVKVPNTETINALTNDVSYLGSLSSSLSNAADFANTYRNIGNFLTGFNIGTDKLTTYIDNEITSLNGTLTAVLNSVLSLENDTKNLSNLITKNDICIDISTLNVSVNNIATGIADLDITAITTLKDTVLNISNDLYFNPQAGGDQGNYTPGGGYAIERHIVDLSDILSDIVKFIDNNVLASYKFQQKNLSDYIVFVSEKIVPQAVASYIELNYTLLSTSIAQKLNADDDLKNAVTLKAYIKSVIDDNYIRDIVGLT